MLSDHAGPDTMSLASQALTGMYYNLQAASD